MYAPFDLDVHTAHLRAERLREAAADHLARQLRRPPGPSLRARLALALHALADRLDSCPPVPAAPPMGLDRNGHVYARLMR